MVSPTESMLGPDARLPRTLFTDRGTGLFNSRGRAVKAYSAAAKAAGFRLYWGDETVAQWTARARRVVAFLNDNYRVDRLCQQFPTRLRACRDSDGERLRK